MRKPSAWLSRGHRESRRYSTSMRNRETWSRKFECDGIQIIRDQSPHLHQQKNRTASRAVLFFALTNPWPVFPGEVVILSKSRNNSESNMPQTHSCRGSNFRYMLYEPLSPLRGSYLPRRFRYCQRMRSPRLALSMRRSIRLPSRYSNALIRARSTLAFLRFSSESVRISTARFCRAG